MTVRRYLLNPLPGQREMPKSSSEGHQIRVQGLRDSGVGSQSFGRQPSETPQLQSRRDAVKEALYRARSHPPTKTPGLHEASVSERSGDKKMALVKASAQGELC